MKILFNCHLPFSLTHGGQQIQMEQSKIGLEKIGVDVEPLRWWDDAQTGDVLHQFGSPPVSLIQLAHSKGVKVVVTLLLTAACNRSAAELKFRRAGVGLLLSIPWPSKMKSQLIWQTARSYDHFVVGLEAERNVLETVFRVPRQRISVVPLGLTDTFRHPTPRTQKADHLICTGTITESKNSLELAQLAHEAGAPLLFVGKPYDFNGAYWKRFQELIDNKLVRHHPHVSSPEELVELLRSARGYVLMSRYENWSLAAHEAVGCGLPALLPDQNWSRERFGNQARYFPKRGKRGAAAALKAFYEDCPTLSAPQAALPTWTQVAEQLRNVYKQVLERTTPVK